MYVDSAAVRFEMAILERHDFRFRRAQNFKHGVLHVLGHAPLILADLVTDARDWHAVLVQRRALHGDAIFRFRYRFAKWMQRQYRRIALLHRLLKVETK